jgi:adenylate kinase
MRLVVLGPPGAGKGTQARNLAKYFDTPHISTGDILRDQMKSSTPIGLSIRNVMDTGNLVSDSIVMRLIVNKLTEGEFILDGYPRTLEQAGTLMYMTHAIGLPIDKVVSIEVEDDIIIERMDGRVSCVRCGEIYHLHYYPPKVSDKCNICGSDLVQRDDDKALTVKNRLKIYHDMTEPIIKFYRGNGLLISVSGVGEIGDISQRIIKSLENGY